MKLALNKSHLKEIKFLTTEQKGKLFEAIINHEPDMQSPEMDGGVAIMFSRITRDLELKIKRTEARKNNSPKRTKQTTSVISNSETPVVATPILAVVKKKEQKIIKEVKKVESETVLPDFIDKELWESFIQMRREIKFPTTVTSRKILIGSLISYHEQGINVNECIKSATKKNYRDIFPPSTQLSYSSNKPLKSQPTKDAFDVIRARREIQDKKVQIGAE